MRTALGVCSERYNIIMAAYIGSFVVRMLRLVKGKRASEEQTDDEGETEGEGKEEEDIEEDEDTVMPDAEEEGGEKDGDEGTTEGEEEEYREATMSFDECEDDVFENVKEEKVVDFVIFL